MPISHRSLAHCIAAFGNSEPVPDWRCPSCGVVGNNRQSSSIVSCPTVLILVLKRFNRVNGRTTKNNQTVFWDDVVSLNDSTYRLISSISHHNSILSGHYTANVLFGGKWFKCNDLAVSPTNQVHNSSDVYLMAFERF